ncbi:MAG: TonB-dependent receptor [Bacteroidales bacterium]
MKRIFILGLMLLIMSGMQAFGQTMTISGIVTDADEGETLPGVSVVIQGTTVGTVTDSEGYYEIEAPSDAVLVFSFVGMRTQEVPVEGRSEINVEMVPDMMALDEVLVVAYGTSRRESFTGVADVIDSESIERRDVSNISRALEGSAPGVQVTSGGGQPGSGISVRLRGFGSMSASNAPLYVVDGSPFDGNINSLNPSDIESMTILRDASAAALYGARGANGVVMITTKSGGDREPEMNFKTRFGTSNRVLPEYPRLSTEDWMVTQFESWRNHRHFAGGASLEDANAEALADFIPNIGNYNPYNMDANDLFVIDDANPWLISLNPDAQLMYDEDFQDELFRTAMRQEYDFNVSGGSDISDYYISLGYLDEEGMAITSGFERISARVNLNSQPLDWFETGLNISASLSDYDFLLAEGTYTTNPFFYSRMMGPVYPVYLKDEQGNDILDEEGNKMLDWGVGDGPQSTRQYAANSNLVGSLELDDRSYKQENMSARIFTQFDLPIEGLNFRTNLSADYYSRYQTTFQNPEHGDAAAFDGRGTKIKHRNLSVTFNQLLNYERSFGDHNLDFLLGHEAYFMDFNYASATRTGFPVPGITEIGIATTMEGSTSYADEYTLEGYFTRLSYDYDNRYYVSGSYRRDGSSRFHEDARWGDFYSLGLSWRITQEDFMQGLDWIDNMRLKASYGEQGNDQLPTYYAWQSFYDLGWDNHNLAGALYSSHENRDLVWESSENFNAGFDARIFDRVTVEADYFIRESTNLLMSVPLPLSTGVPEIDMNVGAMTNNGIELRTIVDIVQGRDFRWSFDLNFTHLQNEITDMPEQLEGTIVGTKRWETGRSYYEYYLREVSHIDPETGSTMFFYDILDEDGEFVERGVTDDIAEADRYYVDETAIPDFYGSFTNNLVYNNFDMSFMFSYGVGGKSYDNIYSWLMHEGRLGYHMHEDLNDRWRQPVDEYTGSIPKVEHGNSDLYPGTSDQYLKDMTYLALKNFTFGYTLPGRLTDRIGVSNLRLFVSGENVAIWNENEGMDPQHSFTGVTDHTYVPVRTITFGLNLQF